MRARERKREHDLVAFAMAQAAVEMGDTGVTEERGLAVAICEVAGIGCETTKCTAAAGVAFLEQGLQNTMNIGTTGLPDFYDRKDKASMCRALKGLFSEWEPMQTVLVKTNNRILIHVLVSAALVFLGEDMSVEMIMPGSQAIVLQVSWNCRILERSSTADGPLEPYGAPCKNTLRDIVHLKFARKATLVHLSALTWTDLFYGT